jgi:mycothiol synthase
LPEGFEARPASLDDAGAIASLVNACMLAELGTPWTDPDEVREQLTEPGRNPNEDDLLVVGADGVPAAYLQLWRNIAPFTEVMSEVFVDPRHWGRGISTSLLGIGEERALQSVDRAPPKARVVLQVGRLANNELARDLFERLGYAYARMFWVMRMQLDAPPPTPEVPAPIEIRTFDPLNEAHAVHAALAEAFEDHWGHGFPSFEQWRHHTIDGGPRFDPELWFVAHDGDEVVGVAACLGSTARDPEAAEVDDLGVRRAWRRRGIGRALLLTAFAEFHRRGVPRAELGVDSESLTGATRLYERAGMHVAFQWEFWEKEVRPASSGS